MIYKQANVYLFGQFWVSDKVIAYRINMTASSHNTMKTIFLDQRKLINALTCPLAYSDEYIRRTGSQLNIDMIYPFWQLRIPLTESFSSGGSLSFN